MIALFFPWLHWPWEHLPHVKQAQPWSLAQRRPGRVLLPGRGALSTGGSAARPVSRSRDALCRPETRGRRCRCAEPRALAHAVSLCISTFQFLLVRKDHCFGRKQQLYKRLKIWTLTNLFYSWVFELLTFKWLNFYKVRYLMAFIHSVFLKDMRITHVQTLTETEKLLFNI